MAFEVSFPGDWEGETAKFLPECKAVPSYENN